MRSTLRDDFDERLVFQPGKFGCQDLDAFEERPIADEGDFHDAIYVGLGVPSEAAQRFTQSHGVQLWGARELAAFKLVLP